MSKKKSYGRYTFDTDESRVYMLRVIHDPEELFGGDIVSEFGKQEFLETLKMGIWTQGMTLEGSDGRVFKVIGRELEEVFVWKIKT